ncbi:hypothetical protein FXO38_17603 [Capsicum annuum]|nr:hypothetical protein FXO37_25974 [Capsicum annuum]KAF3649546.1 hypothetical protein FXO38_17603 [Capsicum annuum]
MRRYRVMSLEFDNYETEGWRDAEPSRCPFFCNLEIWSDVEKITSKSQDLFNVMGSMYAIVIFFGVQNTSSVQPVVDVELTVFYRERAARMYSVIPYAFGQLIHLDRFQEEVIKLLLAGIEAILSSDDLQVASEDAVYDFFLKWTRAHYPLIDEC